MRSTAGVWASASCSRKERTRSLIGLLANGPVIVMSKRQRRTHGQDSFFGTPRREIFDCFCRQKLPLVRQPAIRRVQWISEQAADIESNPHPATFSIPQQRIRRSSTNLRGWIVQELGHGFD